LKRYSDFWRALAAGLLLGSVLIGAAVVVRSHDSGSEQAPQPALPAATSATRLRPMRARGCTDTWTAATTTSDWTSAANWSAGRIPGPADRACIPDGALVSLSNGTSTAVGSVAVEGTLSLDGRAVLDVDDPARPSSIVVLVLRNATLRGRSPLTVTGTFSWDNGGVLEGPGPMRLGRRSNTTFDPGDGGKGVLKRPLLTYGEFDLASGAVYVVGHITNFGNMHGNVRSPRGFPAGFLDGAGRPVKLTGKVPPGLVPGSSGRPSAARPRTP
jgi:hypothetical protein